MPSDRIAVDPKVRHGKPVIRGTRVPVDILVGSVAGGMAIDEVAEDYGVTRDDMFAALRYAAGVLADEEVGVLEDARW